MGGKIMEITYNKAYVEVLEFLKCIPINEFYKIPKEKIDFMEENKDREYNYKYDITNPVLSKKAKAIITNLYMENFASQEEKTKIKDILKLNSMKSETEKQLQYGTSIEFKNKYKNELKEQNFMIAKKDKWYEKIIMFFKNIKNRIFK